MESVINISHLSKKFRYPVKDKNSSWLKNLFNPEMREIVAVDDVSFSVNKGERIAFIGPNGAGKSTTIKMLTGILFPSAGKIDILGLDPSQQRRQLAYRIGTVFGQRSQLLPNLPLTDSLEFFGVMYDMDDRAIEKRVAELVDLFHLQPFLDQPVRKLSLGQRMRAEVAASLIHSPEIIMLDEPTIGLDVLAKKALRDLLLKINREDKVTIFLTSHDVGDIEMLCDRTIIINHGRIVKDLPTAELARSFIREKYIDLFPIEHFHNFPGLPLGLSYRYQGREKITVAVDLDQMNTKDALKLLPDRFEIEDIDVYSADLEGVIRRIYGHDAAGQ